MDRIDQIRESFGKLYVDALTNPVVDDRVEIERWLYIFDESLITSLLGPHSAWRLEDRQSKNSFFVIHIISFVFK